MSVSQTIDMAYWLKKNAQVLVLPNRSAEQHHKISISADILRCLGESIFCIVSIGPKQNNHIEDYVEASIILHYNNIIIMNFKKLCRIDRNLGQSRAYLRSVEQSRIGEIMGQM